jgi:hypothetical protein
MTYFDNENTLDNELDYQFQKHYSSRKTGNNGVTLSKISEIDPSTPVMFYSVNVFFVRTLLGKTFTCIKEFIKIFRASERTDLLVYISKNPNIIDPIFHELRSFMRFSIVFVSADEADEYIKHLIAYKTAYEKIVEGVDEDLDEQDEQDLLNSLAVPDFSIKSLHTITLLEDSVNSRLLKPNSYICSLLSENRQPRFIFFINIQYWKGINASIKPNFNLLFIFGTFSKQQINYILQQVPLETPFEEFYEMYRHLSLRGKVIINCDNGRYKIIYYQNYIGT